MTATAAKEGSKASERLLALFPDLAFDRAIAERVLREKHFHATLEKVEALPENASLNDVLGQFRHDSSAEEFLWHYIEAMTGQGNIHELEY